jgi:two-component system, response regulator PdtaR
VFTVDPKVLQVLAPHIQRALVIDPAPAAVRLLSDLLRNLGATQVYTAATTAEAMRMAASTDPQLILVEHAGPELDGCAFVSALRRSRLGCRKAAVIMITAEATPSAIIAARDAGVHEFLRKPYTVKELLRRLEAVALKPRDWIEAQMYVGPDRRRFNSENYGGRRKRKVDGAAAA